MADRGDDNSTSTHEPPTHTIALVQRHTLQVETRGGENVVRLLTPDGKAHLTITITAEGISLRVAGDKLTLEAEGALQIRADELSLHGKKGVSLTSDGDATVRAAGDLFTEARGQDIRARLGNVNVTANDDVKLVGERIRLNT